MTIRSHLWFLWSHFARSQNWLTGASIHYKTYIDAELCWNMLKMDGEQSWSSKFHGHIMVTWSYRSRESEFFPAYPSSLGLWTPKDKRSIMQALECLGVEMGLMISDWLPCSDDLPGVFFCNCVQAFTATYFQEYRYIMIYIEMDWNQVFLLGTTIARNIPMGTLILLDNVERPSRPSRPTCGSHWDLFYCIQTVNYHNLTARSLAGLGLPLTSLYFRLVDSHDCRK